MIETIQMAKRGGKRAGAGAKAKGTIQEKKSAFATRITEETREMLEAEVRAGRLGRSISQVAERLLRDAFKRRQEVTRDDPVQALCYSIAELSQLVCNFKDDNGNVPFHWRNNLFMFEAMKYAIVMFMDLIKPPGEIRSPAEDQPLLKGNSIWGPYDTPEDRAKWALSFFWHNLQTAKPIKAKSSFGFDMPDEMATDIERTAASMFYAREALLKRKGRD